MPIPGDNGNPKKERDAQNERIRKESLEGALVKQEVSFEKRSSTECNIFGEMHK